MPLWIVDHVLIVECIQKPFFQIYNHHFRICSFFKIENATSQIVWEEAIYFHFTRIDLNKMQKGHILRSLFIVLVKCMGGTSNNYNPGWSMVDRFSGIRFEIHLKHSTDDTLNTMKQEIVQRADRLACFGWVQESTKGTLVGEARLGGCDDWYFLMSSFISIIHNSNVSWLLPSFARVLWFL